MGRGFKEEVNCHMSRSYIPLLLGVSIHLHRYFGSRLLIDILSSLGVRSYKEAILYGSSNVMYHQPSIPPLNMAVSFGMLETMQIMFQLLMVCLHLIQWE
ncbi:hypothetical protein AVEN_3571-1 [Araneus ventricosus]|uniref:Uncharacterized protein n=1 Tax=Araneus ventricosus TaxID=182803 RepID=A0A4Y2PHC9_ARAVE|nr:hypothetical protein AVEN_3571-1 [Araneus ventricosus]